MKIDDRAHIHMKSYLRATFKADEDGTGELRVEVFSAGFAGQSAAWFGQAQLLAFAEALHQTYPLSEQAPLHIQGGHWDVAGSLPKQTHVGLKFYPVGGRGHVGCPVILNTPCEAEAWPASQNCLSIELLTSYEKVGSFARALRMVVAGGADDAVLEIGN